MQRFVFKIFILVQLCSAAHLRAESEFSFYQDYDVRFIFLNLSATNTSTAIEGFVETQLVWKTTSSDTLFFELTDSAKIDSVLINGKASSFVHISDLIKIIPESEFKAEDKISCRIYYRLPGSSSTDRSNGIFNKAVFTNQFVTYTLSEPFYAKMWFPCKQDLTDKADSVYVYLTLADSLLAGSNGTLKRVVDLENGQKRMEWESNHPIVYYLISITVADYMEYNFYAPLGNGDSVWVQNYIYNDSSYLQANKLNIDATADMLMLFSELFGIYPFEDEKYGHCVAPLGGGMEHQTMTTLQNFNFRLVAHELAHQWFGDNVTCADWQNIWINEGFASYGEYIAYEGLDPGYTSDWLSDAQEYVLTSPGGSVYVPEASLNDASRIFDYRLSYRKGALILHMLRHELSNDEMFFTILTEFQNEYADSVATAEDFKSVVNSISGKDFTQFFNQWYYGEGYPKLNLSWEQKDNSILIYIDQKSSAPQSTPFFNLLLDFNINYLGGDTLVSFRQEAPQDTFKLPITERVYQVLPDPRNYLLKVVESNERLLAGDSLQEYNVFPNPAKDFVYIENYRLGREFNIKLFDNNGKLLVEAKGIEAFTHVNLAPFPSGIYQLILAVDDKKHIFNLSKL